MAERALATAFVNVVPGTKDFEAMLKGQLAGNMPAVGAAAGSGFASGFKSKFSNAIRGVAAPLVAAFGVYQTGEFLKGAIQQASDLNEQGAAVGQVFGKGAGAIEKFAAGAAASLGQSNVQVLEASKQFGIYGKAAGLGGDANAEFSKGMVQLATDLASFNNTSVDDAILALGSGLRGEAEPLRRFGVLLDDATLRAQAMQMGLIKTTKEALTPQQKVLAAHQVILAQTSTQQGDFARTSEGLANQQRILTAEWSNAQAILGSALMPMFTSFIQYMNVNALPAIKTFFEDFKAGKTPINDIGNAIGNMTNFVKDNWTWISSLTVGLLSAYAAVKLVNGVFAVATGIQTGYKIAVAAVQGVMGLWKVVTGQATVAQLGLNMAMLANPIGLVVAAVALLTAGLVWFFTQTEVGKKAWASFAKFLGEAWDNIVGFVKKGVAFIINIFLHWTPLGIIMSNWKPVMDFFGKLPERFIAFGKNIIDGLMNGLVSAAKGIGSFFTSLGDSAIGAFKNVLGIRSPSKVFAQFGKNILQGLHQGLMSEKTMVVDAMKKVSDWITDAFNNKKITKAQTVAARMLISAYATQLKGLEKQQTELTEKLDAAQKDLADKIAERADYVRGLAAQFGSALSIDVSIRNEQDVAAAKNDLTKAQDKYNEILKDTQAALTDIEDARLAIVAAEERYKKAQNPGTTAQSAIADLKSKLAKTQELASVTDQLMQMGLSKSLYKQIVESGAVDFARSIIEGGAEAVSQLNVLSDQSDKAALELATKVGDTLFDQGIKFAQSIVSGLQSQEAALTDLMSRVAARFEKQISGIVSGAKGAIEAAVTDAKNVASKVAVPSPTASPQRYAAYVAAQNPAPLTPKTNTKNLLAMAAGGFVNRPTQALIGEAGPEVVTPLKDFERMMGMNQPSGPNITYVAAPNQSLDSEQALFQAIKRAKVVGAW